MIEYPNTPAEALADLPGFVAGMTETRVAHHAAPSDPTAQLLADVSRLARIKGFQAIAIINQGGREPFVVACMDERGRVCDPRSYDTHATPEGALEDLFARLGK